MIVPSSIKEVAQIYECSEQNIHNYLFKKRTKFKELGNSYINKSGKKINSRKLNVKQLKFIVEILDQPPKYNFNGKGFVKQAD